MEFSTSIPTSSAILQQSSTDYVPALSHPTRKPEPQTKPRRKHANYSFETRSAVIDAYERGDDWRQVAHLHGVKPSTARDWISAPEPKRIPQPKNKIRRKAFNDSQSMLLLEWISDEPRITLHKLVEKVENQLGKTVSLRTISRYIEGKVYIVKKACRTVQETAASIDDPPKQRNSLEQLNACQFLGKDIVWIDELTVCLICSHSRGPDKSYKTFGCQVPHLRGRTIQLAVAMNRHGILKHLVKRGIYTSDHCLNFFHGLIEKMKTESRLDNVAFVYDDARCHSRLDEVIKKEKLKVIRLVPYSSDLNPIERLWDETRTQLRRQLKETQERLPYGDSEKHRQQETLMECLEQCANACLTCVPAEHCGQLVDDVLHPITDIMCKPVIKPE